MSETGTPAFNIPFLPDCSCLDKRGMINKVIELKLQCFYTCTTTSYMRNGKIFCFINSWGRQVLNMVKQRCIAGGGQCLKKMPVLVIDRSRVPVPADLTG